MQTDEQLINELDNNSRYNTGLNDIFSDIYGGITDVANDLFNSGKKKLIEAGEREIDDIFNSNTNKSEKIYQQNTQQSTPIVHNNDDKTNFIKNLNPTIVGAGATAIAKYGIKMGWITSLAIGVGTGFAKHYFIDKKGANENG